MIYIRLNRRTRTNADIGYMYSGGLLDAFDNAIKSIFRINDAEFDYICETATDEELELMVENELNFTQKRKLVTSLQEILKKYYAQTNN